MHTDQAGLSRAYNSGIRATTGDVLAFTDDDCVVPTDWIRSVAAAFASEPEGDLLYGQVVALPTDDGADYLTPSLVIEQPQRLSKTDGFKVFGMGANFAARRRLFTTAGYFDEILGGGGKLKSSQDYDLAYRTYKAGLVTLLRPEVTLHHDGRREQQDWPTLLKNYGHGDGAFYTKHVRCYDPYALWLLLRRVALQTGRTVWKRSRRVGGHGETTYLRGFFRGIRDGMKFDVDHHARLYVQP